MPNWTDTAAVQTALGRLVKKLEERDAEIQRLKKQLTERDAEIERLREENEHMQYEIEELEFGKEIS